MSISEIIKSATYLVDADGNKKAVQVDWSVWEELLAVLDEQLPPPSKKQQRLLKTIADSLQAYQTGQVRRGTVEDLLEAIAE